MFDGLYSNFSKKPQRHSQWLKEAISLPMLISDIDSVSESKVYEALVNDLKSVLDVDSAVEAIEKIHAIESNLNKLHLHFQHESFPQLEDFHKDLSQIFLQKYWEMMRNPDQSGQEEQWLLQAIFIAIEEEIYIWQEKIEEE